MPEEAWPGVEGRQVPLRDDQTYIPGLYNSQGVKIRLTFRDEIQQIWLGSQTHTQKVSYGSISKIESQPIEGRESYSILRIQLGAAGELFANYIELLKINLLSEFRVTLAHSLVFFFCNAASNSLWLYFVPTQHVAAIKMRILGVASLLE